MRLDSRAITFIDSAVPARAQLAAALPAGTEVVFLSPTGDGWAQIAEHLAGRSSIDSIHLISHGRPGAIQLGAGWMDAGNIGAHAPQLRAIGDALGEHGDFLVYGCEVAQGEAGQALIRQIAGITRAGIAASTTLTGAADLGGDWELDAQVGRVRTPVLLDAQSGWRHVLTTNFASAEYDVSTGVLSITINNAGGAPLTNDGDNIELTVLRIRGEGGLLTAYTLTTDTDPATSSATLLTTTLNTADRAALESLLNKNGTESAGGTTYNLATLGDWNLDENWPFLNIGYLDTTTPLTVTGVYRPDVASITISDTLVIAGETALVTITFTEQVTDFDLLDLTAGGGVLSALGSSDGGLTWTATFTPSDNTTSLVNLIGFTGVVTDLNGDESTGADRYSGNYVVDTDVPDPGTLAFADLTDTGSSDSPVNTTDVDFTLQRSGGNLFLLTPVYEVNFNGGGWSTTDTSPTIGADGTYEFRVKATDLSGNVGYSNTLEVVIDTTAPTQVISNVDISADTGASDTDFVTKQAAQTVTGELDGPLGDTESLWGSVDGGENWVDISTSVSGDDSFSWTGATLVSGDGVLLFEVRDQAGNTGPQDSTDYLLDTTLPSVATLIIAIDEDTGASGGDFVTGDTMLTVSGTYSGILGEDEKIQVRNDGASGGWSDAVTDGSGGWSFIDPDFHSGDFTYEVRVVDLAGNVGASGDSQFIDIIVPQVVSVTASDTAITDADTGPGKTFTVTVVFDHRMDTDIDPGLTFSPLVGSTLALVAASGDADWSEDGMTYTATYTVADAGVDVNSVTVDVTGAVSTYGLAQANYTPVHEFEIDTRNPGVSSVVFSEPAIDDSDEGDVFTITITFDEAMDEEADPLITFIEQPGPLTASPFPQSPPVPDDWDDTFSSGDGEWTSPTTYVMSYVIRDMGVHAGNVTIDITGATDALGNAQTDYTPSHSFALDTLHLIGTVYADNLVGNDQDDWIYGDNSVDTLVGGGGNDYLDGGAWGDSMVGGSGDDIYIVENTNDKAIEASGGGTDIVLASVNFTLGNDVENLTMTGTGNVNGKGNATANTILGNSGNNLLTGLAGADTIDGGNGNDSLTGGAGNDSLTGGAGNDTFIFDTAITGGTNVDYIDDFDASTDTIRLVKTIFTALTAGTLTAAQWENGDGVASLATHRILLDSLGNLFYDRDGSLAVYSPVQFATLDVADLAGISNTDFTITLV